VIEDPQDWPSGRHKDDGRGGQIQTELLLGFGPVTSSWPTSRRRPRATWCSPTASG